MADSPPRPLHVGAALHAQRLALGHSLRSLAPVVGVSFSVLARIERGEALREGHSLRKVWAWLHPEAPVPPCHCARCVPPPVRRGWQCPGCARCYAPHVAQCFYCGEDEAKTV